MGDPRKTRAKFRGPSHPWQADRINEEKTLSKDYGLKNKQEIWKMRSKLRNFLAQTKKLVGLDTAQSDKERKQLSDRVQKLGLLPGNAPLVDILGLKVNNILDRRLQTLVFKRGMARSIKQARQFITHEHITVNNRKVTSPAYIVSVGNENSITFTEKSPLKNEDHPERAIEDNKPPMRKAKEEDEEKKEEKKEEKTAAKEEPAAETPEPAAEGTSPEAKTKEKPSKEGVTKKPKEKPAEESIVEKSAPEEKAIEAPTEEKKEESKSEEKTEAKE